MLGDNMALTYFSVINVVLTFILLLIGGLVNPMGASLACPDWNFVPTCHGKVFLPMVGGVLYEHGHRLWASVVGLAVVLLAAAIWQSKLVSKKAKILSFITVLMVVLQGTLGGVTVLLKLSAIISTLHLAIAMMFFCVQIMLAFELARKNSVSMKGQSEGTSERKSVKNAMHAAMGLTFAQIVLGGITRHVGAGMACGEDWMLCANSLWPSWGLGQLHMLHRLVGYATAAIVLWASIRSFVFAQKTGQKTVQALSVLPQIFVVLQVFLGILTVATLKGLAAVTLHTAVASLLLGSLVLLYLMLKAEEAVSPNMALSTSTPTGQ
jgi:heme A synthase